VLAPVCHYDRVQANDHMPVIQVKDKQHSLTQGQTRLGAGAGVDVIIPGDESMGLQAILEMSALNQVVIRRAGDTAKVKVNGVALVDPTPLMHGDKVEISGVDVLFSEDKKVGATQFVSASDVASIAAKRAGPARATTATGGRLVSLVDGKEYQIPAAGVTFGREAGSDVVVAQPEVSRRHASIAPAENGYVIQDHSTNGIWVNGNRVQTSQLLARADVVRVGGEEFRFYADVAAPAAKPTPAAASVAAPAAPAAPVAPPAPAALPALPAEPPRAAAAPPPAPAVAAPMATVPPAAVPAPRPEPPTVPGGAKAPAAKPKKEPPTAPAAATQPAAARGAVPPWVWLVAIIVVGVAAYMLGQGKG
jgi:pSer/pThr/pTyr-binding forkhead associated (FHA) protein